MTLKSKYAIAVHVDWMWCDTLPNFYICLHTNCRLAICHTMLWSGCVTVAVHNEANLSVYTISFLLYAVLSFNIKAVFSRQCHLFSIQPQPVGLWPHVWDSLDWIYLRSMCTRCPITNHLLATVPWTYEACPEGKVTSRQADREIFMLIVETLLSTLILHLWAVLVWQW